MGLNHQYRMFCRVGCPRAKDRSGNPFANAKDWSEEPGRYLNLSFEMVGFDAPKEREKTKLRTEKFLYYFGSVLRLSQPFHLGDVNFLDCVEAVQKDSLPSPIQNQSRVQTNR